MTLTAGVGITNYNRTWNTTRGSQLKIEFSPETANFKPTKIYTYTFTITAVVFGTNVDRFYGIDIAVRFLNAVDDISSAKYGGELPNVGNYFQVDIDLIIPTKESLSLNAGESLSGNLQIKVDFSEGVVLDFDTYLTTGWETITSGKISVAADSTILLIVAGLVVGILAVGTLIYFGTRQKKAEPRYAFPPTQTPIQTQKRPQEPKGLQFCPHCGQQTEAAIFCSSCGEKL